MARKHLVLENEKRLVPSGQAVVWRSKSGKEAVVFRSGETSKAQAGHPGGRALQRKWGKGLQAEASTETQI